MNSIQQFVDLRFGLFIHYGLYSLLGRGEWAMNREQIPREEYTALADPFTAENFDAGAICDLAVRSGMRYINFTTMHHDGFRLYDTKLSEFNSVKACGRDLTGEIVEAARRRGLKISLYHSLNNWMDLPDAVDALENPAYYRTFLEATFARVEELVETYNPIDVLWYDGWWPFDADGWQAAKMNDMVRKIQPHILFNGRNGLRGDFATPEGHLTAPSPWRPWEGCLCLCETWGFHKGDHDWKSASQVIDFLATCAQGNGNLLLNVGPRGDGSIPEPAIKVLGEVGDWLRHNGEAIYGTELFHFDLQRTGAQYRGDWNAHGPMTVKGNALYQLVRRWPGETLTLAGLKCEVQRVTHLATGREYSFLQSDNRVIVSGLPAAAPGLCPVFRFDCNAPPAIYLCGGMRTPQVAHPRYDPCESDLLAGQAPA
jgi:alpha-L-fucosidase